MALASFKGGVWWPEPTWLAVGGANPTATASVQLNVASEKLAFIFQAPATDTLIEVDYYVRTVGSSGDLDVRIETVSATDGNPTGTLASTNSNLSATISTTGAKTAVLTAGASLTRGTYYAVVFARTSGDISIAAIDAVTSGVVMSSLSSYNRYHNGTSWQSRASASSWQYGAAVALKFTTAAYTWTPGCMPVQSITAVDFNNASAARERGIRLIPRGPIRAEGFFVRAQISAGNADVVLADSGGTTLATYSGDKDYGSAYGSGYSHQVQGIFAASVDLTAGSTYYLMVKPTSATNVRVHDMLLMDTAEADQMNCMGGGTDVVLATRDSGGSYTVDTTKRPLSMGLIISATDDGAGGGGGTTILSRPGARFSA